MGIVLLTWLVCANLITFCLFGWDKRRAIRGGRRVPERTLLLWVLLLGAPGAYLGSRVFRHKTIKSSFRVKMGALTVVEVAAVAVALWWRFLR
ncbi:MAG TPA: DUF1294 domain-containing protein [Planctomycetes bacterium]|nr:DUF1294 domain-containing protein [Planctomycetota bacterium]